MKKLLLFIFSSLFVIELESSAKLAQALELASMLPRAQAKGVNPEILKLLQANPDKNGVITIPVLQQGFKDGWPSGTVGEVGLTWKDVDADDGANCGYHALKNVLFLMNAIEKNDAKFLQYLTIKPPYFDCMAIWAPMIYQRRGYATPINWLGGEEIDQLAHHLDHLSLVPSLSDIATNLAIAVTEDVRNVGQGVGLPVNETMLQTVRTLAQKPTGMLGVVWTAGHGGHWVGFVVYKKQGALKIYYMNSCNSCLPNFKQAVDLFSMTAGQIDGLIQKNQKDKMKLDLDKIDNDLKVLTGKGNSITLYPIYVGCVMRNGSMFDEFTEQNLLDAGFNNGQVGKYLSVINDRWQAYLKSEINSTDPRFKDVHMENISQRKNRMYGIWINSSNRTGFVRNLDVKDCTNAQIYQGVMLLLDSDNQTSFFNPIEKVDAIFLLILVGWKDYPQSSFDDQIKRRIVTIMQTVLMYLKNNPDMFRNMNWKTFGVAQNVRKFAGFSAVMDAVLDRVESLPGFDKKDFKTTYVAPLLLL